MNRTLNEVYGSVTLLIALPVFVLIFASSNFCISQSQALTTFDANGSTNSSRRGAKAAPTAQDDESSNEPGRLSDIQLNTPDDNGEDAATLDLTREPGAIDDSPTSDDSPDDDESEDEETEEDDEAAEDETLMSDMKSITTDTRFLRININETDPDDAPADQSSELVDQGSRNTSMLLSEKIFAWAAPDIRYQPLYFEDVTLERYGQTPCGCDLRQRALSAAHFYQSAALLPLLMLDQPPQSCDWPLGYCRPGTDTPFIWQKRIVP